MACGEKDLLNRYLCLVCLGGCRPVGHTIRLLLQLLDGNPIPVTSNFTLSSSAHKKILHFLLRDKGDREQTATFSRVLENLSAYRVQVRDGLVGCLPD